MHGPQKPSSEHCNPAKLHLAVKTGTPEEFHEILASIAYFQPQEIARAWIIVKPKYDEECQISDDKQQFTEQSKRLIREIWSIYQPTGYENDTWPNGTQWTRASYFFVSTLHAKTIHFYSARTRLEAKPKLLSLCRERGVSEDCLQKFFDSLH
jgi:hypothetical protein